MSISATTTQFQVRQYALGATLGSGQAFRWRPVADAWEGVVGDYWVRLQQEAHSLTAQFADATAPDAVRAQLAAYLRLEDDLTAILATFPADAPMRAAVDACRGLRLLRQAPWECLASFICSSTKQIVQIQQIVALLCRNFGQPVEVPLGHATEYAFPSVETIARRTERDLRDCKLGFRAPYLLGTARQIADGKVSLEALYSLDTTSARVALMQFPGVGRKIADCVLLFAYGRQDAFPVDVWVQKALHRLYFPRARHLSLKRLQHFSHAHFGPYGGYAQQYLFHYVRTHLGRRWQHGF